MAAVRESAVELLSGKMQLGACGPNEWFDQYFEVTQEMLDVSDNLVFETELLFSESNLDAISLHLFKDGKIPIDRKTEFTSTISSAGMYSIAIASIDLTAGVLYLSIHCGPQAPAPALLLVGSCT